jgi:hypothetical protein
MYLIEILLPVFDNGGRKFPADRLKETKAELSERFGGVTAFARAPAHGEVKEGDKVVHDDIVLHEVMTASIDRDGGVTIAVRSNADLRRTKLSFGRRRSKRFEIIGISIDAGKLPVWLTHVHLAKILHV